MTAVVSLPRLYAIADASFGDPVSISKDLFRGGVRLLQVRDKQASARRLYETVRAVMSFAPQDAWVLVNDRVDVALLARCGVHVGQDDIPPAAARKTLGPHAIIGFSTHNAEQALAADSLPVDYVGFGPVFPTATKRNPDPVVGIDKLAAICRQLTKPVVAIGGVTLDQVPALVGAGAQSVAVIRDLLSAPDVAARTRQFLRQLG